MKYGKNEILDAEINRLKIEGKSGQQITDELNGLGFTTGKGTKLTPGFVWSRIAYLKRMGIATTSTTRRYKKKEGKPTMISIPSAEPQKIALVIGSKEEIIEILKGWNAA